MQMRPGRAAGLANLADWLTLNDALSVLDKNLAHVDVNGRQTMTMVQHHSLPGVKHVLVNQVDHAIRHCFDRCASRCGDVDSVVRVPRVAVENALAAKNT